MERKVQTIYNPIPQVSSISLEGVDFGYFGGPKYVKRFHALCKAISATQLAQEGSTVHATQMPEDESMRQSLITIGISPHGKLQEREFVEVYRRCFPDVPSVRVLVH
ncbi:MAG: hypothetical protein ABSD49_08790 [Candidatus Bathyarchaeia archaeon]